MKKNIILTSIFATMIMSGCSTTSNPVGGNVYDASQLNQEQGAKDVQIVQISPAKIAIDNSSNRKLAQTAGGVLGAVAGAVVGYNVGSGGSTAGTTAGGVAGAAGGVAAGSMVGDKKIVEGVTIAYKASYNAKVKTSTQAGRLCEFQTGPALMIVTKQNETRIQPNSICTKDR